MTNQSNLIALGDFVALLYHEARNVRHLIRADHLSGEGWERVVSLPTNRYSAWQEIQSARRDAKQMNSANSLLKVFEDRFWVDLDDLEDMFANSNWRHAKSYGGNAWANIVIQVHRFADAINEGDKELQHNILGALEEARHNTGMLKSKLDDLDSSLQ